MELVRILIWLAGLSCFVISVRKESTILLIVSLILTATYTILHIWGETGSNYGATIGLIWCSFVSFILGNILTRKL